ncbi:MAG: TRAP transporter permease, partial [Spirochaetia bacterium]|nr:TRAP transporter permease [Spirochaetia bacterium]
MKKNNDTNDGFEPILPTSNEEEMKRMMKELDREQSYREHKCWRQYITVVISVIFVVFQLYATLSGSIPA